MQISSLELLQMFYSMAITGCDHVTLADPLAGPSCHLLPLLVPRHRLPLAKKKPRLISGGERFQSTNFNVNKFVSESF